MRKAPILLAAAAALIALFSTTSKSRGSAPVVILRASTMLDGRGHILHDTTIVVEDGKIARLDRNAKGATYDLRGLTVLPGWIDAHVHPTWHFDTTGRLAGPDEPKELTVLAGAANSWKMLAAGFTTVQSVGSPLDRDLRDAIE